MAKMLLIPLALCCIKVAIAQNPVTITLPNSKGTIELSVDVAANLLTVKATATTVGYIAVGISPQEPDGENAMKDADIIVAGFANGEGYIKDYKGLSTGGGAPTADPESAQTAKLISSSEADGTTIVVFTRLLVSDDSVNHIDITSGPINFIWALGAEDAETDVTYHSDRGESTITLLEDDTNSSTETPASPPESTSTEDPVATTEPDGNSTEDPVATTEPHGNSTEDPVAPTEPDGNSTEDPVAPTEPDGNSTEDPVAPTEPDGNSTEDPVAPTNPGPANPDVTITLPDSKGTIELSVDTAANLLTVKATATTAGYIAVGISPQEPDGESAMKDADIIVAGFANGEGYIKDYKGLSTGAGAPTADPESAQTAKLISSSEADGTTIVVFTRLLVSDDSVNHIDITSGPINFIWALGDEDAETDIKYHSGRGESTITLLEDDNSSPTPAGAAKLSSFCSVPSLLITITVGVFRRVL